MSGHLLLYRNHGAYGLPLGAAETAGWCRIIPEPAESPGPEDAGEPDEVPGPAGVREEPA